MCNLDYDPGIPASGWPLIFDNADDAVKYADMYLNDPGLVTASKIIQRTRVQQSRLRPSDLNDIQDEAETISVELCRAPRDEGQMYRYIYGINRQTLWLADNLAHYTWDGPGAGHVAKCKTIAKARDLALLVMADYRARSRFGRKISAKDMADALKIERQQFYEQWFQTVARMRARIDRQASQTRNALTVSLRRIGIIDQ